MPFQSISKIWQVASITNSYQHPLLRLFAIAAVGAFGLALVWLADPRVGRLWLNTAWLVAGACLVAIPIGTLLATILFKTTTSGRGIALWLLVGMLFIPLYLLTGAWDAGFGIQGWHTLATNPHLAHQPWLAGWRAAVWVHGLAAVPWVVLFVGVGLRTVESELEEDAATCAPPWKVLCRVSIRRAVPSIGVAAVWIATVVMTEISVTDFFQVRTFAEEVYTQAALGMGISIAPPPPNDSDAALRAASTSAIGLWSGIALSVALAALLLLAVFRLLADLADAPPRRPWIWRLKLARWPMAIGLAAMMMLIVGVPLGNLAYKAGVDVQFNDGARVRLWTLSKFVERLIAAPQDFAGEIWLSTRIGVLVATAAVPVATLLAWNLRRAVPRFAGQPWRLNWQWLVLLIVALCLTIPGPLLGLGVIRLLNQPPDSPFGLLAHWYDSNFAPWLVETVRALPIATLVLWPALASVPQAQLDAAAVDGCGWWRQLWWVTLPQRWLAVCTAWLVALAIAVGELAATVLVMPPQVGSTALSIQIFQLLHYGVDDRVAAICLVMAAVVGTVTGIAGVLWKRIEE